MKFRFSVHLSMPTTLFTWVIFGILFLGSQTIIADEAPYEKDEKSFNEFQLLMIDVAIAMELEELAGRSTPEEGVKHYETQLHIKRMKELFKAFFLDEAHAQSQVSSVCLYAGWPSVRGVDGTCRAPWELANGPQLSEHATYSPRYFCNQAGSFRCNPTLFGPGNTGRGQCVAKGEDDTLGKACLRSSKSFLKNFYETYKRSRGSRFQQNHRELVRLMIDYCNQHNRYPPCMRLLSQAVSSPGMNNEYCIVQKILEEAELDRLGKDMEKLHDSLDESLAEIEPELAEAPEESENPNEIQTPQEVVDVGGLTLNEETDYDLSQLTQVERDRLWVDDSEVVERDVASEQANEIPQELSETMPAGGGAITSQLRPITEGSDEYRQTGYYTYTRAETKFGTERTIWRLETAGRILAEQNITMGVGNISLRGGGTLNPHVSHKRGVDVDLRFISPSGMAARCNISGDRSCFDREKTYDMVKALIDVDPTNVRLIFINDNQLRADINAYYRRTTGRNIDISRPCPGHDDHIHMSWNQ